MNEGHPTLVETLQINNNKQLLPLPSQKAMSINIWLFDRIFPFLTFAASKIRTSNSTDAQRYFTVETARGYIIINRKYEYAYLSNCFFPIYAYLCLALTIK